MRYARRTHGIREPEHRLWLMVVSLVLCPASLILWGVGASKGISWVGLVFGMGIISCSTGIGSSLSISYALDSYKDMSGEVMMAVILVRVSTPTRHFAPILNTGRLQNTLSFAIVSRNIHFTSVFDACSCRDMGSPLGFTWVIRTRSYLQVSSGLL